MTGAGALLDELRARGAAVYRAGDRIGMRPATVVTPALLERVKALKADLLAMLPTSPLDVQQPDVDLESTPASAEPRAWIVSRSGDGEMRLVVAADPPWPAGVYRAAALVVMIDEHHRSGRDRDAQAAAVLLETGLAELRGVGVEAWLAS